MFTSKTSNITLKLGRFIQTRYSSTKINFDLIKQHKALVIDKLGEPLETVKLQISQPRDVFPEYIESNHVLVEHLAAPINPADINVIQGVYGIKPKLPTALGNEGTGRILQIGSDVTRFAPGDHVIFTTSFSRSWQTHSLVEHTALQPVNRSLDIIDAAQLKVNPITAFFLLKGYVELNEGDVFIQNGANSACGVFIIQLANHLGFKSINVIRDRPNKDDLVKELQSYGADAVVTESEISKVEVTKELIKKLGQPKLALNCVGGKNAMDCARLLANDGYFITYGAMSKKRIEISAAQIFKNHSYIGHWTSRAIESTSPGDLQKLIEYLSNLFIEGKLKSKATKQLDLDDYKSAFKNIAQSSQVKHIFVMNK